MMRILGLILDGAGFVDVVVIVVVVAVVVAVVGGGGVVGCWFFLMRPTTWRGCSVREY